jgi:O-antigen/teichoic acid export membrane protein
VAEAPAAPLRTLVRRGAAWSTVDVLVNRALSFALGVAVARLLTPDDFGVYAVALVVHVIVVNVSELGVSSALFRGDADDVDAAAPTVTTIALTSSAVLGALMALAAPVLARLLGAPAATATIQVMALTLPLAGVGAVPGALLRRNFRTDRLFVAGLANNLVSGVVVITLALAGLGPLALACSFVAGQVVSTAAILVLAPARPRPGWDPRQARSLLRFGLPLAGANVLGFSIQNVDYVVIGRLLGSTPLGLYMLAFNISGWPQNVFSAVVRSVAVPAFARLHQEGSDMAAQLAKVLRLVARVTFPACLLLAVLAHPLVVTVYGARWAAAADALAGLALFAATRTIMEVFSDFLLALGRTRAILAVQVVWLPVLAAALVVFVGRFGIAGAGAAHAAVAAFVVVPSFVWCVRRAGVPVRLVVRALLAPLGWAAGASAAAWAVAAQMPGPLLACLAGGTVGVALAALPYLPEARRAVAGRRAISAPGGAGEDGARRRRRRTTPRTRRARSRPA